MLESDERLTGVGLERDLDGGEDQDHARHHSVDLGGRKVRSRANGADEKVANDQHNSSKDDERASAHLVDNQDADQCGHNSHGVSNGGKGKDEVAQPKESVERRAVNIDKLRQCSAQPTTT